MWFDVLILGILLVTTIRGAVKGVVWQLAAIASLVLCFVFAQSGSLAIAPMIPLKPPANRWTAMFIIYLISSLVAFGAARFLRDGIEKAKFTEYDKHLGAIFGFVKGAVISLVVIFFSVTMSDGLRDKLTETYSGRAAAIVMDRLHDVLPDDLLERLEPYIHRLDRPDLDLKYGEDHDHGHRHDDYARDDRRRNDDPFFDPNEVRDPNERREPIDPRDDRRNPFERPRGNDPFDARNSDPRDSRVPDPRDEFLPRRDDRREERLGRDREPDFFNPPPRDGRRAEEQGGDVDIVGDIRKKLSGALESEVEDRIRKALRNTAPEDQSELSDLLSRALPSRLGSIADDWRYGRPDEKRRESDPREPDPRDPISRGSRDPLPRDSRDPVDRDPGSRGPSPRDPLDRGQPAGRNDRDPAGRGDRDRLLTEIAKFYSDDKESQDDDRKDFEEHLAGVPERVAVAVLRDWQHDLSEVDRDNDPDPDTHFNTKLDVRILNQLKAARIPISSLDRDLQDRLRDSERR